MGSRGAAQGGWIGPFNYSAIPNLSHGDISIGMMALLLIASQLSVCIHARARQGGEEVPGNDDDDSHDDGKPCYPQTPSAHYKRPALSHNARNPNCSCERYNPVLCRPSMMRSLCDGKNASCRWSRNASPGTSAQPVSPAPPRKGLTAVPGWRFGSSPRSDSPRPRLGSWASLVSRLRRTRSLF